MILYGHRGARGEAPENTVAGFLYARRLYLEGVTLDLRLSSDGTLVVIHDATVDRTTGARGPVSGLKASKLASLDARAEFPQWPERTGVPGLDDALDACSGIARLAIEVQPDESRRLERLCTALIEMLEDRRIASRVTVRSSEAAVLETVGRLAPGIARSYVAPFAGPADLGTATGLGCQEIDVSAETGSALLVQVARENGPRVTGRLANTPDEIQTFVEWGVDAIASDFPSVARRLLGKR
jgi:glycerophosphoryl diester phosphodiesterase